MTPNCFSPVGHRGVKRIHARAVTLHQHLARVPEIIGAPERDEKNTLPFCVVANLGFTHRAGRVAPPTRAVVASSSTFLRADLRSSLLARGFAHTAEVPVS